MILNHIKVTLNEGTAFVPRYSYNIKLVNISSRIELLFFKLNIRIGTPIFPWGKLR